MLWIEGVKDYVKHAEGLLEQFKDAVDGKGKGEDCIVLLCIDPRAMPLPPVAICVLGATTM